MWFNGFTIVIDMALAHMRHPVLQRHREALILGTFREDVCFVGGLDAVFQNPSMSHFCRAGVPGGFIPLLWPDAGARSERLAKRALSDYESGKIASAMVQLGRALHPLIDMSCPVHAQGVAHTADPFEWCVESMGEKLRAMPVTHVPRGVRFSEPALAMARIAQGFAADRTSSPWGRVMKRAGMRKSVDRTLAREQAKRLIPAAAGCTVALFELFFEQAAPTTEPSSAGALGETLSSLEMSESGLRRWFAQLDAFCARHGGRRHYADLLDLLARCSDEMNGCPPRASTAPAGD